MPISGGETVFGRWVGCSVGYLAGPLYTIFAVFWPHPPSSHHPFLVTSSRQQGTWRPLPIPNLSITMVSSSTRRRRRRLPRSTTQSMARRCRRCHHRRLMMPRSSPADQDGAATLRPPLLPPRTTVRRLRMAASTILPVRCIRSPPGKAEVLIIVPVSILRRVASTIALPRLRDTTLSRFSRQTRNGTPRRSIILRSLNMC